MRSGLLGLTSTWFNFRLIGWLAVVVGLMAWLWPIGVGGKMPVGGDVTSFSLGLMGVLSDALRAGRLPLWNDLWGYGFPGLAESQMGVYYPPHLLLYRFLSTESAYVVSLVAHTLWGGLGAFWAARRLGISQAGAVLAAWSWSLSGFFLIHLAHPWGYTAGSWMPWVFGLAWGLVGRNESPGAAAPFLLSLALVLQVLPGHFQLAFQTQFSLALLLLWAAIEHWGRRVSRRARDLFPSVELTWGRMGALLLTLVAVVPLSALQLLPTARLAEMALARRGDQYLYEFAATPFHLVNYVAPGFFHRATAWRPLVWDPFHTSPEESLAYAGLVPLFLALMTMVREFRRQAAVRLLTILVVVSLVLSLGPYAPGFRYVIMLPGFSFFRAPARWSVVTALGISLLVGKGLDRWKDWVRPGRSLGRLVVAAFVWTLAVVGIVELALGCTSRPGWPAVARGFQMAFSAMPWTGDPSFEAVMARARQPAGDARVPPGLAPSIFLQKAAKPPSFVNDRSTVYILELWESAALLAALFVFARLSQTGRLGGRTARALLLTMTFLDLWVLGWHRLVDVGPLRPLTEQSQVLARLAREPRGTRVVDEYLRNLPMLVGAAPIVAYRTLDLPAVGSLTALARERRSVPLRENMVREALRATGTGLCLSDPVTNRIDHVLGRGREPAETIEDLVLAGWLFGESWAARQGRWVRYFSITHCCERPARAWLIPFAEVADPAVFDDWSGDDPREILEIFKNAKPLDTVSSRPGAFTIRLRADEPSWVVISQLADPQWKAYWFDEDGKDAGEARPLATFHKASEAGGWQRLAVPGVGCWTLRLEYDARAAVLGMMISAFAWAVWLMLAFHAAVRAWSSKSNASRAQTEA